AQMPGAQFAPRSALMRNGTVMRGNQAAHGSELRKRNRNRDIQDSFGNREGSICSSSVESSASNQPARDARRALRHAGERQAMNRSQNIKNIVFVLSSSDSLHRGCVAGVHRNNRGLVA